MVWLTVSFHEELMITFVYKGLWHKWKQVKLKVTLYFCTGREWNKILVTIARGKSNSFAEERLMKIKCWFNRLDSLQIRSFPYQSFFSPFTITAYARVKKRSHKHQRSLQKECFQIMQSSNSLDEQYQTIFKCNYLKNYYW